MPQGWTPPTAPIQTDWTPPSAPVSDPTFRTTNEKDAQGNAVVGDFLDRLVGWLPAAAGMTGGVVGSVGGPPGAIMGAALGGAAGEAYKELIRRARGTVNVPATPTDAAKAIGVGGVEQGAAQATGEALGPLMSWAGQRFMQSAVKPGLKLLTRSAKAGEEVPRVVQTLLDNGISVSPSGLAKLQTLLGSTNQEISAAIQSSSATAATISPYRVASRLSDTAKRFATQVNPQADLNAIADVGNNFLESTGGKAMTLLDAQALKKGTYEQIGSKYGQSSAASIESEKALARGLKEEIANEVPDVSALNAREGKLLEALDAVGKRVALNGNNNPVGIAWAAHNPMTFIAALMDRSPVVKSLLARGLYQGAGIAAKVEPQLIRVAMASLLSGSPDSSSDPGRR